MPTTWIDGKPPTATAQHRRHLKSGKTHQHPAAARASAWYQAGMEGDKPTQPLTGPVAVRMVWTWPAYGQQFKPKTTRPDLDNLAKLALDAMVKAGWIADDNQVASLTLEKFTGPMPGFHASAEKIPQNDNRRLHPAT